MSSNHDEKQQSEASATCLASPPLNDLLEPLGLALGDYCHGHRWGDKDPNDPFAVGYLCAVRISKVGVYYKLEGCNVPDRWWRHCEKVTREEGQAFFSR